MSATSHSSVFVYGTLMVPQILEHVLGRVPERTEAVLQGYCRRAVAGESYPAIVNVPMAQVSGCVLLQVTAEELALLDAYEGPQYRRDKVPVTTADNDFLIAETYVLRDELRHILASTDWNVREFVQYDMKRYLKHMASGGR